MLVGREAELRRFAELVAGVRVKRAGTLLVRGDPGVGKSALLAELVGLAGGTTVVHVTGSAAEERVPYAGLALVLGSVQEELERLPPPQARALAVALALDDGGPANPFAVGAAALGVLTHRAGTRPITLVLDDVHLLDAASAAALTFVARRLLADPILLVAALRSDASSPLAEAGLPVLVLQGLDDEMTAALLSSMGADARPATAQQARRLTGGNPLALRELVNDPGAASRMTPGGVVPLPDQLVEVYAERARRLGEAVETCVALVAVTDGDLRLVTAAATLLGLDGSALATAEEAGLLTVTGATASLTHPLVGSATYSILDPVRRRALHAALADVVPSTHRDLRVRHLALAAAGPDEGICAKLDEVAEQARRRGAFASASTVLENAADLSLGGEARARRLLGAAEAAWSAGDADRARTLGRAASIETVDAATLRQVGALTGVIAARTGSLADARAALLEATEPAGGAGDHGDTRLLAELVNTAYYLADGPTAAVAGQRAAALLAHGITGAARARAHMVVGMAEVLAGRSGEEALRASLGAFDVAVPDVAPPDAEGDVAPDVLWPLLSFLWLRESGAAARLQAAVDRSREDTALGALPRLLFHVGRDQASRDGWTEARSSYAEAVELARELAHVTEEATSSAGLAGLDARTGRHQECVELATRAIELARPRQNVIAEAWARFALGESALSLGGADEAIAQFQELDALLGTVDLDVDVHPGPELAEALVLAGRIGEAGLVAHEYHTRAEAKGHPWARARAARARGLLVSPPEIDEVFSEAEQFHTLTTDTFERARTALVHGELLRRARRRVDARVPLRSALETFERLGALAWTERAARELEATGETVVRRGSRPFDALTPRERQIVDLLSQGLTTREAAVRLFVSPKTIEYHLRNVYSRLGVGSRPDLFALLAADRWPAGGER